MRQNAVTQLIHNLIISDYRKKITNKLTVALPQGLEMQGRLQGGWTQLASKFGLGGKGVRELHAEGGNSYSFCSQKVKQ